MTLRCPRCEVNDFTPYGSGDHTIEELEAAPYPALSRVADIYICSDCGTHEAFQDLAHIPLPAPKEWPLVGARLP